MPRQYTLFYYGSDGNLAKELAKRDGNAGMRDAGAFMNNLDAEKCDRVVVSPTVPPHQFEAIRRTYGNSARIETPGEFDVTQVQEREAPRAAISSAPTPPNGKTLPAFYTMTNRELRDWAIDHDIDVRDARNKEQLISRIMAQV